MTTTDQHSGVAENSRENLLQVRHDLELFGRALNDRNDQAASTRRMLYDAVCWAADQHMSVTEVARLAGLTRQTVYNILKKEEK